MDRKSFHHLILLITYAALLVLVILKLDALFAAGRYLLVVLKPLLWGFAIAFVLSRPCAFFFRCFSAALPRARGAALGLAVLCSYLSLFLVVALIVTFIVPQLMESVMLMAERIYANLPAMQQSLNQLLLELDLEELNLSGLFPSLRETLEGVLGALSSTLPHLVSFTSNLVSNTVTAVLSFVFSVYMLAGRERLVAQCGRVLRAYASPRTAQRVSYVVRLTSGTFTKFVSGQLIEACILGGLCFVGMNLLRFPYAPLISVIIGISALIPVAGAYIGAILSALLLVMISPVQALGFLVFLVILQQVEGNLIYPRVVGGSIGLPALWVLTAVTVGGSLFGLLGMLLGVPAASVCYTLLRGDVRERLARRAPPEPPPDGDGEETDQT